MVLKCRTRGLLVAAILGASLLTGAARAACVASAVVTVPWRATAPGWMVPIDIDGTTLPFLLDTGAERSMIFAATATQIGIPRDEWVATTTRGIGGDVRLRNADPRSLSLGGLALRRHTIAADNTLVVAPGPPGEAAGLLGQDFLSPYDIAIDGPRGILTLFAVRGCAAATLPWAGEAATVPAIRPTAAVLLITVDIDGHRLSAEIDSGATTSLVTAAGLRKLGLTAADLASDRTGTAEGVGPRTVPLRRHRFASVAVGGVASHDVDLWVGPAYLLRGIDMFLGRDWLSSRKIWISFATDTVFVGAAPDGGF